MCMKKIMSNNRIIAILFFTVFSIAAAPAAFAGNEKPAVPVELSFLGHVKNQPLFLLNFKGSETQNEFTIIITDEGGNTLYRENIKGENFSKKFLLNTDELGDAPLHFTIFCKNTKGSVEYTVNRNVRTVREVVVNEEK
jgi:hypothetical protein